MKANELSIRLKKKVQNKEIIISAGVDNAEDEHIVTKAGADFILFYPTDGLNMDNRFIGGFFPFGNINKKMESAAQNIIPFLHGKYILAAVNGSDPFKIDNILLKKLQTYHFTGIHNYPTIALVDGEAGSNMNVLGMGFSKETNFFKKSKSNELFTCAMVRTNKQASEMVKVHTDAIVFYLGLGERKKSAQESADQRIQKDIKNLKSLSLNVRAVNLEMPLLFYSERLFSIEEIKTVIQEVPEVNGYHVMCNTSNKLSNNYLKKMIIELKKEKY